mgnify:FL=1
MRLSQHLGKTLREDPKNAQTAAHKWMLRAGYIRQVAPGLYICMPFLLRTLNKISRVIRNEMSSNGFEELLMPALQPKELWEESGRWGAFTDRDGTLFAFKDRRGNTVCLGPSHEEVITDIIRREISSYKHLPKRAFQIQTKFTDESRPRFGLMRARESIAKNAYTFDMDEAGLDASYQAVKHAYRNIFERVGLTCRCVETNAGALGGIQCHEFVALVSSGEDNIVFCDTCEYGAIKDWGESRLEVFEQDNEEKPMKSVQGKGLIGVEPLAAFLNIPVWKTTKTLLYQADEAVTAVMVRGDCDVNEAKVKAFLGCRELTLAAPEVIEALTGAEVGYAGPVGLPPEVVVIADYYTKDRVNFECGANRTDHHNINVNFDRDLPLPTVGDFKMAKEGDFCPRCDAGKLREASGFVIGHTLKLGTGFAESLGCTYLDKAGKSYPVTMGVYEVGLSRMAAALVEQNHDPSGIIWPARVAPFQVHLIALNLEDTDVKNQAEALYQQLVEAKIDVLFDDRDLRAGEKFSDADLLGMPMRLTVSKRTVKAKKIEVKFRNKKESKLSTHEDVMTKIRDFCK